MKILFLILEFPSSSNSSNLYVDLALEFKKNGHEVFVITPGENNESTSLKIERGLNVLRVKTLKQRGVENFFIKGIAQLLLPFQFNAAYKEYMKHHSLDLILMPTPPITLVNVVKKIKKVTNAKFYLILRDIYPQGAADLDLVKLKIAYYYLRYLEIKIYKIADIIGCMSRGNIDYILRHNQYLNKEKFKLLPNWQSTELTSDFNLNVRSKYNLTNKFIVLFGGTIGYAQKVENIITLANEYKKNEQIVFLVIGDGVKKKYLESMVKEARLNNVIFMNSLPRNEYLQFVRDSDVGLITIDERFTVPTLPSKTTSYFLLKLPILAVIDKHTDYGKFLNDAKGGLWSIGGDDVTLFKNFNLLYKSKELRYELGNSGYNYFMKHLTSEQAYLNIMNTVA